MKIAKRSWALSAAFVLLSLACSQDSDAFDTAPTLDAQDHSVASTSVEAGATGAPVSEADSSTPLSDFLGYQTTGAAATAELDALVGAEIGRCMRAAGFEYIDPPPPRPRLDKSETELIAEQLSSKEWVTEWGYGVSTRSFSQSIVGPNLKGYEQATAETEIDHNQLYFDSLMPPEQDAYRATLFGESGCVELATEMAFSATRNDGFIEAFGDDLIQLDGRVDSDPRIVAFDGRVAECIASKGYDYPSIDGVMIEFSNAADRIFEMGLPAESGNEAEPLDYDPTLSPDQLSELAELQKREIETALDLFDCGGGIAERWALWDTVRAELEREFIEENREALMQFVVDE